MRLRGLLQFVWRFGGGEPQAAFVVIPAGEQEVQRERRFPDARRPFNDIQAAACYAAAEDRVEAANPCCGISGLDRIARRISSHVTPSQCEVQAEAGAPPRLSPNSPRRPSSSSYGERLGASPRRANFLPALPPA